MRSRCLTIVLLLATTLCFLISGFGCGGSNSSNTNLTGINVAPISPSVAVGGQQQFTATAYFSVGPSQDVTANATWTSNVTDIATINNQGTKPGLATGVGVGSAMISASFTQGSSTVSSSTDLTVSAQTGGQMSRQPEGMASVSFLPAPGVLISGITVDGLTYGDGATLPVELAAGLHRFVSPNGHHRFAIVLLAQRTYCFEILPEGRIVLRAAAPN